MVTKTVELANKFQNYCLASVKHYCEIPPVSLISISSEAINMRMV